MPSIGSLTPWLRALFRRARVETEMDREMRLHLDMEAENNVRLGMSADAARRAALIAFGGVEKSKEAVRDERRTRWLEDAAADFRYAIYGFRRQPLFTSGVVLLIALGVGASAAVFGVMNNLLLSPLRYPDGNRMVQYVATAGGNQVMVEPTRFDVDQWRVRTRLIEQIVIYRGATFAIGDSLRGPTEQIGGALITPGVVAFVGTRPLIGRDVLPSDTLADAPSVVLLGYALWQRVFAGRREAVGSSVVLDGTPRTIIGVLPSGFKLPFDDDADAFVALRSTGGDGPIDAMAKLRAGVSADAANSELQQLFTHLDRRTGQDPPRVMRAIDRVSKNSKRIVFLMFAAALVVLLISCVNVANLLLARARTRQREFAIRAAMGAHTARLVRQLLTESLALSIAGGLGGLGVALLTHELLRVAQPQGSTDFTGALFEPVVFVWGFGVCLVTGLLFGLAPAMFVAGAQVNESLKAGARAASGSTSGRRFRDALVAAEVALSAVLLIASGLLARTSLAMQHADIGIDPAGLMGVRVTLTDPRLSDPAARRAAVDAMVEQVRAIPSVRGATLAMDLPPRFSTGMGELEIDGGPTARSDSLSSIAMSVTRPDFFAVTGARITEGRVFANDPTIGDRITNTEVVVNESFARRFWPSGGAVGARVRRGNGPWSTIVGVAADVIIPKSTRAWNRTQFYQALPAAPLHTMLIVRSNVPLATLLPEIEGAIRRANPFIKIGRSMSSDAILEASRTTTRFTLMLIGGFATLALILAALGLHAVIAYTVSQRTREIGVRVALGAQRRDVMRLVVGQGLGLATIGIAAGAVGGIATARTMRAMLYGTTAADPATLIAVSALLGGVAIAASYAPARRAVQVDPVEALRSE
jgi:putative ABC transport system permease protein